MRRGSTPREDGRTTRHDAVRLAYLQRTVCFDRKRTDTGLQRTLQEKMGGACTTLELLSEASGVCEGGAMK